MEVFDFDLLRNLVIDLCHVVQYVCTDFRHRVFLMTDFGDFFRQVILEGAVVDAATVNELAEIPPKEVLVAKLLGSIKAPLYNFAYAIQAVIDKDGAPAEEAAEA